MKIPYLFLLLFLNATLAQAQDLFNYQNSLRYAQYLFSTKEYESAITELNRCLFLSKGNEKKEVMELLLTSYRKTKQFDNVLKAVETYLPKKNLSSGILNEVHYSFFLNNSFKEGSGFLQKNPYSSHFENLKFKSSYYVFEHKYDSAYQTLYPFKPKNSLEKTFLDKMNFLIIDSHQEKHKSPLKAALLSVVIPGLGKFYSNRKKDAIFSFILTIAAGYQSYRAFNKNGSGSVIGWTYGILASGFYVGNIYGSAKAAQNQNEFIHEKYHQKMLDILGL